MRRWPRLARGLSLLEHAFAWDRILTCLYTHVSYPTRRKCRRATELTTREESEKTAGRFVQNVEGKERDSLHSDDGCDPRVHRDG